MDSGNKPNEGLRVEKPSQGTKPLDKIFENDAIVNIIFPFLDIETALSFSTLNRTAWSASNSDDYWANPKTLGSLWKVDSDKGPEKGLLNDRGVYLENNPHKLSVTEASEQEVTLLMDRIKLMSMAELRRSLALCRVNIATCVEKMDYRKHLQAALTFEDSLRDQGAGISTRSSTKLSFPDWALNMNAGKASYFHAKRERMRRLITRGELLNSKWAFHFNMMDELGNVMEAEAYGAIEQYDVEFHEDDTLTSSMHQHRMRFTYELAAEEGSKRMTSYSQVRVEQFPALLPIRLPSGMWRMENQNVVMQQKVGLTEIPLL